MLGTLPVGALLSPAGCRLGKDRDPGLSTGVCLLGCRLICHEQGTWADSRLAQCLLMCSVDTSVMRIQEVSGCINAPLSGEFENTTS